MLFKNSARTDPLPLITNHDGVDRNIEITFTFTIQGSRVPVSFVGRSALWDRK